MALRVLSLGDGQIPNANTINDLYKGAPVARFEPKVGWNMNGKRKNMWVDLFDEKRT
jgi:hypothetical protein